MMDSSRLLRTFWFFSCLLNEGSGGYLLGGGEAAKKAIEEAASGLELHGPYIDNIFALVERKRSLNNGRNEHMQKQAEALTTTTIERLRELYASSRKMTAGVVFGTGNGMLQEEVCKGAAEGIQTQCSCAKEEERSLGVKLGGRIYETCYC